MYADTNFDFKNWLLKIILKIKYKKQGISSNDRKIFLGV